MQTDRQSAVIVTGRTGKVAASPGSRLRAADDHRYAKRPDLRAEIERARKFVGLHADHACVIGRRCDRAMITAATATDASTLISERSQTTT
jgi:hypothetical protein